MHQLWQKTVGYAVHFYKHKQLGLYMTEHSFVHKQETNFSPFFIQFLKAAVHNICSLSSSVGPSTKMTRLKLLNYHHGKYAVTKSVLAWCYTWKWLASTAKMSSKQTASDFASITSEVLMRLVCIYTGSDGVCCRQSWIFLTTSVCAQVQVHLWSWGLL